jgi:sporulation protein YlmC with PRC-barrel domain
MKTASFALAALLLAAPAALAQTTTTTPADKPAATTTADGHFYSHRPGEMRASKLIGTNVTNAANESVGEINDVVLGKDGKVAAVIIAVGGFLGMGEREVAISYSGLKFARDSSNRDVITVNATKDQLKAAPAWKWENATTTPRQ